MKSTRYKHKGKGYFGLEDWVREQRTDNREALQHLRSRLPHAIIEELTPMQSETMLMHFYEGKSMRQIAQERGVSVSTVSRTIARAKKRLERCLKYIF